MNRSRVIGVATFAALIAALVSGLASAAVIKMGPIVITADGGFTPNELPRHTFVPIKFQGHAQIRSLKGGPPPALRQVKLEFDRDGLLTTAGLATCEPARIEATTPAQARGACAAAMVGTGHVKAAITLPERPRFNIESPLTLFNGPRLEGNPTVIAHAHTTAPIEETYITVIPIERQRGLYRYKTKFDLPTIAGGYGALTHVDAKIGKRYVFKGDERSYTSARCSDGILQTKGLLWFADGNIVSGSIYKPCNPIE
jgi:hypothetical protein